MNLWDLRENVRQVKPNCSSTLADQFVNKQIQAVIKKRSWSDLYRISSLVIPNQYNTGSISTTQGSPLIAGAGTAWPVNDAINGTLSQAVAEVPGVCDIYPDAVTMAAIQQGDYLLLDQEVTASMEVVLVTYAGKDHFSAYCTYPHAAGHSIQKSSLANRQLTMANNQVATVKAVYSSGSLLIDQAFGGTPLAASAYYISLRYVRISATAYRLIDAVDPVAGVQIGTDKTDQWLNRQDPQRTTTGTNPLDLISMSPNPAGVMQWELWPAQTAAYVIPVLYIDGWPRLKAPNDLSPFFINDEIFTTLATADALMTRAIPSQGKQDPYYDPVASNTFRQQGMQYLEEAIQQDEGRRLTCLQDWQQQVRNATGNTAYDSDHLAGWPGDFGY